MPVNPSKNSKGFTLIEIMIALMLGIIVIGGALSIFISTIRSSIDITNSARLNYDIDSAMQLMVNDIRRSGSWGGAIAGSDASDNLFTIDDANILISDYTDDDGDTHTDGCILYSYDADGNGIDEDPDNRGFDMLGDPIVVVNLDEYFGFRMDRDAIWMRSSVTAAERAANTVGCGNGNWNRIIEEDKIFISKLKFSNDTDHNEFEDYKCLNVTTIDSADGTCASMVTAGNLASGQKAVETRQINIFLDANILNEATVSKSLTGIVKVRNDRIFTQ